MRILDLYTMMDSLDADVTFMVYTDEDNYYECSHRFYYYAGTYDLMPMNVCLGEINHFKVSQDQDTVYILLA